MQDRLRAALADRYLVERELGAGGMATVYLAQDRRHDRPVALKVLRPEFAAALGTERFLREIKLTARLSHPHILPLLDSGEAGGFLYYVMPYVAGETLRDRLQRDTQLPVDDALRIAREVADALHYAHRQGVIHRDIKPENILLGNGHAVVADFGIARAITEAGGESLTVTGLAVGTPAYMSPEQASGAATLDGRADIYALGCVLFEMLAGEPPHTGPTAQAVIAKRLADPVPSVRRLREAVPEHVALSLDRALAKVPADRFPTAAALAEALARPSSPPPARGSLAVLPFANLSAEPENEYFSDGITEDLIAQISKIRDLKVISRTSAMRYKGTDKPLRQIGEELGVGTILEGSVRRAGNRVRVVAQLIDAKSDDHLWAETYDRELTDVFAIQSEVALRVATALEAALSPAERVRVEKRPTANMEAYDLYLLGRHEASKRSDEGLRKAIEYFERALEKDPAYAAALAGLADAYVLSGIGYRAVAPKDAMTQAKVAALRALELDESLPEAHAALGYVHMFASDWPAARRALERAIELNPSYVVAHQWYAHFLIAVWDYNLAVEEARKAQELDPLSVLLTNELGWPYQYMGRHDRAREQFLKALAMDPGFAMAHYNLGNTHEHEGRYDEAMRCYERALAIGGRLPFLIAGLAGAGAKVGRTEEARRVLRELVDAANRGGAAHLWVAYLYDALGESEPALDWLERGYEARAPFLSVIGSTWLPFNSIRDHPRFRGILKKLGVDPGVLTRTVGS